MTNAPLVDDRATCLPEAILAARRERRIERDRSIAAGKSLALTTRQASILASTSVSTIHRWLADGRLKASRAVGSGSSKSLILRADLLRFLGLAE